MQAACIACCQNKDGADGERELARQLVEEHGPALVNGTIRACLFFLPTYMIPESAEVLYELMLVNRPVSFSQSVTAFFPVARLFYLLGGGPKVDCFNATLLLTGELVITRW